jgi:hypothetical protein
MILFWALGKLALGCHLRLIHLWFDAAPVLGIWFFLRLAYMSI